MTFDPVTRSRLVGVFVEEAQEALGALEAALDRLRDETLPEPLADFGRSAHGLKGAAASLGFEDLAAALHAVEALSLQLDDPDRERRSERHRRLIDALELLGHGIAEMSASGRDAFPAPVALALHDLLGVARRAGRPPAGGAPRTAEPVIERLSVPAADVDEVLRAVASLARAAAALEERLAGSADASAARDVSAAAQQLEASIAALRLVPAGNAFAGLAAEVEHLASRLRKKARLEIRGREVRADRRTLQTARGLVRHLVRNAIDHGLETPQERIRAGKAAVGFLALSIETADSMLRVALADDGAGFDLAAVRRELARRLDAAEVAALSDADVLHRFATEGGSTRDEVSEISGRGLGLSAVAASARAAGGSLDVSTRRGSGSTVTFTLPLDVYAVEVLTVSAGGRLLGIPLAAVERTVCLGAVPGASRSGPSGRTLSVAEGILPLANLAAVLGGTPGPERFAVAVRAGDGAVALGVEEVANAGGVLPVTVPGIAHPAELVTGLARLGDGSVLQVVNPRLLAAAARTASVAETGAVRSTPATPPRPAQAEHDGLDVVLAEDSLATREVLRVLLEQQGFRVRLAADGEEALGRIRDRIPDVLVTDINMPRRDGLALTRDLRAVDATARLPVILLTSQDDPEMRAAGASAGADAYLLKSRFDAEVLRETLVRLGVRNPR